MSFSLIILLVPFVVFWPWSPGPKCLTYSQHQVRGIVCIVASLHQHSECVYLGNPKYTRDLPTY